MAVNKNAQTWLHAIIAGILVVIAAIAVSEMRVRPPTPDFNKKFEEAVTNLSYDNHPVLEHYTGVAPVDLFLRVLVIAFLPGAAGFDKGFQVLLAYFLISFFSVISVWCIEAGRRGHRWSLISFPAVWALFYQTVGGAIIVPLFYLAYMRTAARRPDHISAQSSTLSTAYAKSLVPALFLGYLLPTLLIFYPYWNDATLQKLVALWQPSPLFVSIISLVLTPILSQSTSSGGYVGYLNMINAGGFITNTILHLSTLFYCLTSTDPEVSLTSAFDLRFLDPGSSLTAGLKYVFQFDFWAIMGASLVWAYLAYHELRQARRTNIEMIRALVYLTVGTIVLGPAATLSATWYWRERILVKSKTP